MGGHSLCDRCKCICDGTCGRVECRNGCNGSKGPKQEFCQKCDTARKYLDETYNTERIGNKSLQALMSCEVALAFCKQLSLPIKIHRLLMRRGFLVCHGCYAQLRQLTKQPQSSRIDGCARHAPAGSASCQLHEAISDCRSYVNKSKKKSLGGHFNNDWCKSSIMTFPGTLMVACHSMLMKK